MVTIVIKENKEGWYQVHNLESARLSGELTKDELLYYVASLLFGMPTPYSGGEINTNPSVLWEENAKAFEAGYEKGMAESAAFVERTCTVIPRMIQGGVG